MKITINNYKTEEIELTEREQQIYKAGETAGFIDGGMCVIVMVAIMTGIAIVITLV